jgi:hypothetical protein
LQRIQISTFAGCVSLVTIVIPASVEVLESNCFGGVYATGEDPRPLDRDFEGDFRFCISLESITFEKGSKIKEISEQAFTGCISLRSICIPASVEVIGNNCFGRTVSDESYGCESLEFVIIESGSMLREVGSNVFKGCYSLPRVEIFGDFTQKQRSLFCNEERRLWVREIENGWSLLRRLDDYCLLEEAPREFEGIPERSSFMGLSDSLFCRCIFEGIPIPSFVNRITGRWSGIDCDVREIEIPSSIEMLQGFSVFFRFSSLENLRFAADSKVRIIDGFRECKSLSQVFLPSSVEYISGFSRCELLSFVSFATDSQVIEIEGFEECVSLGRIEIPPTVEVIPATGFLKCKSLSELIIAKESELREIAGFQECAGLHEIIIPASVEVISATGFLKCESLSEIAFENESHLKTIAGFQECTELHEITIPASVEFISATGFLKCTSLSEINFEKESDLKTIGGFRECTGIHEITIPTSVEFISSTGFSQCTSLTNVLFAKDSHMRQISSFQGCESLCEIEIPRFVKVIKDYEFRACQSLREVRFAPGSCIREIHGFRNCYSLSYIEIPRSVQRIGDFAGCALPFQITLAKGGNLKVIQSYPLRKFIVYEDDAVLKQHRDQNHLVSLGFRRYCLH